MKRILTDEEKGTIYEEVREILADELGRPLDKIRPEARIIEDLGGDSLIYLELIEEFKKKYQFEIEVRIIGRYLLAHPVNTVEELTRAIYDLMEKGEDFIRGDELLKGLEIG